MEGEKEKNMAKIWARKFYKSKEWKAARREALNRTGGLCQWCYEQRGEIVPADEVHHIIPLTPENINNEDIALNPSRLVPLCHACHDTTKNKNNTQPRRWAVDSEGVVSSTEI